MLYKGLSFSNWLGRFFNKTREGQYNMALCCIVKDENNYLEEWINYHRKIGVDHFFIYDNDSKTPVSDTLKNLALDSYATVIRISGRARQIVAYNDCLVRHRKSSRWIGFIDADEFIVPKSTNGDLPAFLQNFEKFGGIGVNWLIFGSNGHKNKTNRSQLESFLLRSEVSFHLNYHVKMIVQTKFVRRSIGAHQFTFIKGYYAVNENFVPITSHLSDVSVNKIQLNHYFCRSLEEHHEKVERGLADTTRRKRNIAEFYERERDANKVEDRTILDILNMLK